MITEDIQGARLGPVGRCIYCGSDGSPGILKGEHIIPYCLKGRAILLGASCGSCEAITSYIDGYMGRSIFYHLRVHAGIRSRKGKHPTELPIDVVTSVGRSEFVLPIGQHPFLTILPALGAPGAMRGAPLSADFSDYRAHAYHWIPPDFREVTGLTEDNIQVGQRGTLNLSTFARSLAKIAYCHAVIEYGLGGFDPLHLPDVILGRVPYAAFYVGSAPGVIPPPDKTTMLHSIGLMTASNGKDTFVVCRIRLFANCGTETEGMPIYEVITGSL